MVSIQDRADLERSRAHERAVDAIQAGIEAAHPTQVIRDALSVEDGTLIVGSDTIDLGAYDRVVVLGGGKAAGQVARALETKLGPTLADGLVVTSDSVETETVTVRLAAHPVPDERGVEATRDLLEHAREADGDTLVLAVITGGGSALMAAPVDGLDLVDVQAVTRQLLAAGAPIDAINAVRKHCSAIKGGRFAAEAHPARVVGLLLSDVVGDDVSVIASGPTAPDPTTYEQARSILERFDVEVPSAIRTHLGAGAAGNRPETPGPDATAFQNVENHVIANARTAIDAASETLATAGYEPLVLSARVRGQAREQALAHVAIAEECRASGDPIEPPAALLSGGETTVTVTGDGEGGPNQEFALRAAIEGLDGVCAAVDTDGRDGGTDAAGAIVNGTTVEVEQTARDALDRNDSYSFLAERECLIETGPTGTNVNDLRVIVLD